MPLKIGADPHDYPVFVLSLHRAGGTLLTRLLNCHPGLVIWGEHAGLLNKLADSAALLQAHDALIHGRPARAIRRQATRRRAPQLDFDPWVTPFDRDDFLAASRGLVKQLFATRLHRSQRWGFKEIRYHTPELIGFLHQLFPRGQFVLLDRDPIEVCVSGMLVSWGLSRLLAARVGKRRSLFEAAVADCLYAIEAVRSNLRRSAPLLASQVIQLRYERLAQATNEEICRTLGFLGLRPDRETQRRIQATAASVAGATLKAPAIPAQDLGLLTASEIRQTAAELFPGIVASIAAEGVDRARLRRPQAQGGFCWLIGDHAVTSPRLSTMF